jgi:transcriptional regulator with XRE-family HTH domain
MFCELSRHITVMYGRTVTHQAVPITFNQRVGANLQLLRKAAGKSQADLAHELTIGGFPFTQQTLVRVESGSRPLKFEEAIAISELLGINPAALHEQYSESQAAAASMRLQSAIAEIARIDRQIAELRAERDEQDQARQEAEAELQEAGAIRDKDGRLFWLLPREKGDVIMPADGGPLSDDREAMGVLLGRSMVAHGEGVAENARA